VLGELGYLRPYCEVIGRHPFSSTQVRYGEEELRREFDNVHRREGASPAPDVALNTLVTLGILRHSPGRMWRREPYDYEVPPLYRFKLVPSPKGRV
jgi:hypothetical protein